MLDSKAADLDKEERPEVNLKFLSFVTFRMSFESQAANSIPWKRYSDETVCMCVSDSFASSTDWRENGARVWSWNWSFHYWISSQGRPRHCGWFHWQCHQKGLIWSWSHPHALFFLATYNITRPLIPPSLLSLLSLQNEEINGHYKNVKFMCADVTSPDLNFSNDSMDLIFSNWLLMYLSDKEVTAVEQYTLRLSMCSKCQEMHFGMIMLYKDFITLVA